MSKRVLLFILDGFGIGVMDDYLKFNPKDRGANTAKSVLLINPDIKIPNLLKLGLINAIGENIGEFDVSSNAVFGKMALKHFGADSFFGHQEIMGTEPKEPLERPFFEVAESVYNFLITKSIKVRKVYAKDLSLSNEEKLLFLVINECAVFADNLESMPGSVYNLTCSLDIISFQKIQELAKLLRNELTIPRIIAFGGSGVTLQNILEASEVKGNYFGINAPRSGVYKCNYQVVHMGYGIDATKQVPYYLEKIHIPTIFLGKVADIVVNNYGKNIPGVATEVILKNTLQEFKSINKGFVCANIQETDLAGHAEDAKLFGEKIQIFDEYLTFFLQEMDKDDLLMIIADHGNDPCIKHSLHTREYVPLLIASIENRKSIKDLGIRHSMADVGKTILDYFAAENKLFGKSFLEDIK